MIDLWAELKWVTLFVHLDSTESKCAKIDQSDHFNN